MGRPLQKLNKDGLKYIIENSGKISNIAIGKHLGVHYSTIIYYQKKIKRAGIGVKTFQTHSAVDTLIEEYKKNLK